MKTRAASLLGKLNQQKKSIEEELVVAGEEVQTVKTVMSEAHCAW